MPVWPGMRIEVLRQSLQGRHHKECPAMTGFPALTSAREHVIFTCLMDSRAFSFVPNMSAAGDLEKREALAVGSADRFVQVDSPACGTQRQANRAAASTEIERKVMIHRFFASEHPAASRGIRRS